MFFGSLLNNALPFYKCNVASCTILKITSLLEAQTLHFQKVSFYKSQDFSYSFFQKVAPCACQQQIQVTDIPTTSQVINTRLDPKNPSDPTYAMA